MNIGSSEHELVAAKRVKAQRYSAEPWRFEVSAVSVTLRSDHGERTVSFVDNEWSCSCEFFSAHKVCSHTIALHDMLAERTGVTVPAL
jgi:hypothetical protein